MPNNDKIKIGMITSPHGIKGNVKIYPYTDILERFNELDWVYIDYNKETSKLYIKNVFFKKNMVIAKFIGIDSREDAERLKNALVLIDKDNARELPNDTYLISDIIGITVKTEDNNIIGIIKDVISTGSNDVYVIEDDFHKEILIPAIKDVIYKVDVKNGCMIIRLMEGLIDKD